MKRNCDQMGEKEDETWRMENVMINNEIVENDENENDDKRRPIEREGGAKREVLRWCGVKVEAPCIQVIIWYYHLMVF